MTGQDPNTGIMILMLGNFISTYDGNSSTFGETINEKGKGKSMEDEMKRRIYILMIMTAIFASSCAGVDMNKGQQGVLGGAAGGALIGQAIGRDTEATLIGAAVGSLLGYIVGNEMDKYDRRELNHAYEYGQSGYTTSWQNPDNGNYYQVTPEPAYTNPSSPQVPCRRAEILATIDGRTEKTYTTACRNNSGQWELKH